MNVAESRRRRLPDHVAASMVAILDHFWQQEVRDYLARSREEQHGHVFHDMLTVRQWLNGRQGRKPGV